MNNRYIVTLERAGKVQHIVMREDDYAVSVKVDRGNNAKLLYGKTMWTVTSVRPEF